MLPNHLEKRVYRFRTVHMKSKNKQGMQTLSVLIYGDSLLFPIKKLVCTDSKCTFNVFNSCVPGMTVQDAREAEDKKMGISMLLAEDSYDCVVVYLGTNDFALGDLPDRDVLPALFKLLKLVPAKALLIVGYPFDEKASLSLSYLCHRENYAFLPFPPLEQHPEWLDSDGIHLNAKGVTEMESRIASTLQSLHSDSATHMKLTQSLA